MRTGLLALLLCVPTVAQDPTPTKPAAKVTVGQPAPKFRLNNDQGAATRVGGDSEDWTVIAFYPKALTGG